MIRGLILSILVLATAVACSNNDDPATDPTTTPQATATPEATATTAEQSSPTPITAEPTAEPTPESLAPPASELAIEAFLPAGSRPHDVAPAADGGVWFTAQGSGHLGWLDPGTGETRMIPLGAGSAPHGVIVGPDGDAWVTDGGLNAIVRVSAADGEVSLHIVNRPNANLNTAAFDGNGVLWFTGQDGIYGRFFPEEQRMEVFDAPRGRGPYGIAAAPDGGIWMASLAGSYLGQIDIETGDIEVLDPPTANAGVRRVWMDSQGRAWVSEWNAGKVGVYDPATGEWQERDLPGDGPQPYAVYVDEHDMVWLSDFGANTMVRFNPGTEEFDSFALPSAPGNVRQVLGREGEVWGAESAADQLIVVR